MTGDAVTGDAVTGDAVTGPGPGPATTGADAGATTTALDATPPEAPGAATTGGFDMGTTLTFGNAPGSAEPGARVSPSTTRRPLLEALGGDSRSDARAALAFASDLEPRPDSVRGAGSENRRAPTTPSNTRPIAAAAARLIQIGLDRRCSGTRVWLSGLIEPGVGAVPGFASAVTQVDG
jgi:hypothetical protein